MTGTDTHDSTVPVEDTGKILLVDDDPSILKSYSRNLRRRFCLDTASDGASALQLAETKGPYAVAVVDMYMQGMSGMELLMRLNELAPETVRIMITGAADHKIAVDAVNKGEVFRFLEKPCSAKTLATVLGEAVERYREGVAQKVLLARHFNDIQDLSEKLAYHTKHDFITGLLNRHAFEERLQPHIEPAQRGERKHALCYLDLAQFHIINEVCGHVVGDELLRRIGQLLTSHAHDNDLVARLAGDEFGIFLADLPLESARRHVEKIHTDLKGLGFEWDGRPFDTGASIGIVPVDTRCVTVTKLLSTAETACNVAKEAGRNSIHVGGPDDSKLTSRRNEVQWVARINKALQEERFRLFFQTIAPITERESQGEHYELLIRMEDDDGTILPPKDFLQAAEHYRLSPKIDRWVIGHAVEWLTQHPDRLQKLSLCSINLSGHSLSNQIVLDFIQETFRSGVVPPEKICFEVTETAAIANLGGAIEFIQELRAMGFKFALDDFGSGLSSFAYLRNLPVDLLKIDGMFVRQMDNNSVDMAMVRSINDIGHEMGKKTIAEFVENQAIMARLREIGVDYAQGYFIAPPRPLNGSAPGVETSPSKGAGS